MQAELNDDQYEEEWLVVLSSKGEYILSKNQALIVKQAIATGQKAVIFGTFTITIPYIVEFYRTRRFLKDTVKLPERATEKEFQPIPEEKWQEIRKEIYGKIGKKGDDNE